MIPNVSCERCHGPGRAHVEAARRRRTGRRARAPLRSGPVHGRSLLTFCGTCHRHPSRLDPGQIRPDDPQLARFQPVGILQSRCFRESGGPFELRHLPRSPRAGLHRPGVLSGGLPVVPRRQLAAAPAPRHPDGAARNAATPIAAGTPCPVEPRGDCVNCHMPARRRGPARPLRRPLDPRPSPGEPAPRGPAPNFRPLDFPEP